MAKTFLRSRNNCEKGISESPKTIYPDIFIKFYKVLEYIYYTKILLKSRPAGRTFSPYFKILLKNRPARVTFLTKYFEGDGNTDGQNTLFSIID